MGRARVEDGHARPKLSPVLQIEQGRGDEWRHGYIGGFVEMIDADDPAFVGRLVGNLCRRLGDGLAR